MRNGTETSDFRLSVHTKTAQLHYQWSEYIGQWQMMCMPFILNVLDSAERLSFIVQL